MGKQKILVVVDGDGGYEVFGEAANEFDVHWVDWRDIEEQNDHSTWYARDILVDAEHWPSYWKNAVDIEALCELVEHEGIELPDWIRAHRDNKLLETLRQLETM